MQKLPAPCPPFQCCGTLLGLWGVTLNIGLGDWGREDFFARGTRHEFTVHLVLHFIMTLPPPLLPLALTTSQPWHGMVVLRSALQVETRRTPAASWEVHPPLCVQQHDGEPARIKRSSTAMR